MKQQAFFIGVILLAGMFLVSCQNHSDERILYVAPGGDDRNPGTMDQPLVSLQVAAEKATAGTTVFVREGTYVEPLLIQHSGTEQEPIRFEAYQGEDVFLSGKGMEDDLDDVALIEIDGHSYITIDGFTIGDVTTNHVDKTVIGILITGASQHIEIVNNTIQGVSTTAVGGNAHGIAVYGNESITDIRINQNTLTDLRLGLSEALVVNGDVSHFTINDNHVYETDNIGIDVIGYEGIAIDQSKDYARHGVIQGNVVHHNSSYENPSYEKDYSAGGIYVDGGSDVLIQGNRVYQNDIGIEATSEHKGKYANHIDILNNVVFENSYTGIAIGGYDTERGGTTNTVIAGNVVSHNDTVGLEGAQLLVQYDTFSNQIEQNQFSASQTGLFISNEYDENENMFFSENEYVIQEDVKARWLWENKDVDSLKEFQRLTGSDRGAVFRAL
ncbi:right-handed parallel beta-helix repeat-containing protein [Shouchella miscanthi]|uniref:Right-handed parallel beta-helix repeat-containing protein n=1 Tax=Shouchella miscanthi TaxID=2598861 RepID=A0ABU6NTG4_9BACI|nr:right-handed parallel beta-helix repeat-containing protein [Shouchella miscanthi]